MSIPQEKGINITSNVIDNDTPPIATPHITTKMINFDYIIDNYYPNSFHLLRPTIQDDVRNAISNRYDEFENLAKDNGVTLDDFLEKIYQKTGKFPFYLNKFDILQIKF